ncbi:hypothetical protein SPYCW_2301 [Sphingopyxis sp. EG6]|nr:hypothetical protein SPYCW_2301 [Sphingopyxis sp. EG6]
MRSVERRIRASMADVQARAAYAAAPSVRFVTAKPAGGYAARVVGYVGAVRSGVSDRRIARRQG